MPRTWERPIFYVRITVQNCTLHLISLHLKSKLPIRIEGQKPDDRTPWKTGGGWAEGFFISSMKRVGQALEAARDSSQRAVNGDDLRGHLLFPLAVYG
jgi:hypothetical protein